MRRRALVVSLLALIVGGGILGVISWLGKNVVSEVAFSPPLTSVSPLLTPTILLNKTPMQISSPAWPDKQPIPTQFTCDGADSSPPLAIGDVPVNAKALALIMDDPDAPQAKPWVHWLVWNMPVSAKELVAGQVPEGAIQGINGGGQTGYGGPCPPSGTHRYFFHLYALDSSLDLPSGATREQLEQAMVGHVVDQGELMGTYKRL